MDKSVHCPRCGHYRLIRRTVALAEPRTPWVARLRRVLWRWFPSLGRKARRVYVCEMCGHVWDA